MKCVHFTFFTFHFSVSFQWSLFKLTPFYKFEVLFCYYSQCHFECLYRWLKTENKYIVFGTLLNWAICCICRGRDVVCISPLQRGLSKHLSVYLKVSSVFFSSYRLQSAVTLSWMAYHPLSRSPYLAFSFPGISFQLHFCIFSFEHFISYWGIAH